MDHRVLAQKKASNRVCLLMVSWRQILEPCRVCFSSPPLGFVDIAFFEPFLFAMVTSQAVWPLWKTNRLECLDQAPPILYLILLQKIGSFKKETLNYTLSSCGGTPQLLRFSFCFSFFPFCCCLLDTDVFLNRLWLEGIKIHGRNVICRRWNVKEWLWQEDLLEEVPSIRCFFLIFRLASEVNSEKSLGLGQHQLHFLIFSSQLWQTQKCCNHLQSSFHFWSQSRSFWYLCLFLILLLHLLLLVVMCGLGRNDILVNGMKISGSAYKISGLRAFHHGTLLINVDMNALANYLNPNKAKLKVFFLSFMASILSAF